MQLRPLPTESPCAWRIEPQGRMRVPAIIYADQQLIEAMDDKVFNQLSNVATLPGIQQAAYAMPDAGVAII
jgi:tRNA-splicing ligase RtcB